MERKPVDTVGPAQQSFGPPQEGPSAICLGNGEDSALMREWDDGVFAYVFFFQDRFWVFILPFF